MTIVLNTNSKHLPLLLGLMFLLCRLNLSAQVYNAPQPAPNQNLPGSATAWSAICASDAFNDYWVNFTWSPPLVNANNEFILELSDASGNFDAPIELDRQSQKNTSFDFYFQFSLPQVQGGEGYKMRVRGTNPAIIGPESDVFPMYFLEVTTGLHIRPAGQIDFGNGLVKVCDAQEVTLEIYDLSGADTHQYNWYKDGQLLPEKEAFIQVSQAGNYAVEIDYGSCAGSGNTLSNQLQVYLGTEINATITPPTQTAFCPGEPATLAALPADANLVYTWFKDGNPISNAISGGFTFNVDTSSPGFEGIYSVLISGESTCESQSQSVALSNISNFSVSRLNPETLLILPTQTSVLEVGTDAVDTSIQWYKDNNPLAGQNANTLEVSTADTGTYFARVSLSSGNCLDLYKDSPVTTVQIPEALGVQIAHNTQYTPCETNSTTLGISEITASDAEGITYDVLEVLREEISWEWLQTGSTVAVSTGTELPLSSPDHNGTYQLVGKIGSYEFVSNSIEVFLTADEEIVLEASASTVCEDGSTITIGTSLDLNGLETIWFRDGLVYEQNTDHLQINQAGTYELWVYRGGCPSYSQPVTIEAVNSDLIRVSPDTSIAITQGVIQQVTASGADSYIWMDASQNILGTEAEIGLSEAGTYQLLAMVGGCQVSKTIDLTYRESQRIPNVVSANGDGINDLWIIPSTYAGKAGVEVVIYNSKGQEVFRTLNYQNNWPPATLPLTQRSEVFYYSISDANQLQKKGTLTVIR